MDYVISDIHGMYDKFMQMLGLIDFNKNEDRLYILGDIIDRGPNSIKMMKWVYSYVDFENIFMTLGNHDNALANDIEYALNFGNLNTFIESLPSSILNDKNICIIDFLKNENRNTLISYVKFIRSLPLYLQINISNKNYILTHAGINLKNITKTTLKEATNQREQFYLSKGIKNNNVIIGHTPIDYLIKDGFKPLSNKSICINNEKNIIGIDCGACFSDGCLGCLRLNDLKEFYI